ncbi:hypothetical protein [Nocardia sp. NPDC058114]|uniref:hypothetical protein n=1 Tax=Nocardia sp. NPDC058114 TaxID=3346346 RepID=UPI0036D8BDD4
MDAAGELVGGTDGVAVTDVFDTEVDPESPESPPSDEQAPTANTTTAISTPSAIRNRLPLSNFRNMSSPQPTDPHLQEQVRVARKMLDSRTIR